MSNESTRRLPLEVIQKINSFFVCYQGLGKETSPREIWEEKRCGSLNSLLSLFQDNATEYNLNDGQKSFVDSTIVAITSARQRLTDRHADNKKQIEDIQDEQIRHIMECRKFFKKWVSDYDKAMNDSEQYHSSTDMDEHIRQIVYRFYDLVDYMLDLKEAVYTFIQNYRNKQVIKTLIPNYKRMCCSLQEKLESLLNEFEDEMKNMQVSTWKRIVETYNKLREDIERLSGYFSISNLNDVKSELWKVMESIRKQLKYLWTITIRYILNRRRGIDIAQEY